MTSTPGSGPCIKDCCCRTGRAVPRDCGRERGGTEAHGCTEHVGSLLFQIPTACQRGTHMKSVGVQIAAALLTVNSLGASAQAIQSVETTEAPPPGGHYSQAVIANGFVFVSGQLPVKLGGQHEIPDGIEAQTRQALSNVGAILRAAHSSLDNVVSVTVYVTDIANWPAVNRVYAEVFGKHRPARVVAVSPQLHFGSLIEIQAIGLVGK